MSERSSFLLRVALCADKHGIVCAAFSTTTLSKNGSLGLGATHSGNLFLVKVFAEQRGRND